MQPFLELYLAHANLNGSFQILLRLYEYIMRQNLIINRPFSKIYFTTENKNIWFPKGLRKGQMEGRNISAFWEPMIRIHYFIKAFREDA